MTSTTIADTVVALETMLAFVQKHKAYLYGKLTLSQLFKLTTLDLSNCDLASLPPEIGCLSNLKTLSLLNNRLTMVPDGIGKLSGLTVLTLQGNQLTSLPSTIGNLTNLQHLTLHENKLSDLPKEMASLTELLTLSISFNRFATLPTCLNQMVKLRELFANNNLLTTTADIEWSKLTNLSWIDLSCNKLMVVPVRLVHYLSQLKRLNLANNDIQFVPSELANLSNLKVLNLSHNQLGSALPVELAKRYWDNTLSILLHGNNMNIDQLVALPITVQLPTGTTMQATITLLTQPSQDAIASPSSQPLPSNATAQAPDATVPPPFDKTKPRWYWRVKGDWLHWRDSQNYTQAARISGFASMTILPAGYGNLNRLEEMEVIDPVGVCFIIRYTMKITNGGYYEEEFFYTNKDAHVAIALYHAISDADATVLTEEAALAKSL